MKLFTQIDEFETSFYSNTTISCKNNQSCVKLTQRQDHENHTLVRFWNTPQNREIFSTKFVSSTALYNRFTIRNSRHEPWTMANDSGPTKSKNQINIEICSKESTS